MVMFHMILCDVNHFMDEELHSIIDHRKYKFGYHFLVLILQATNWIAIDYRFRSFRLHKFNALILLINLQMILNYWNTTLPLEQSLVILEVILCVNMNGNVVGILSRSACWRLVEIAKVFSTSIDHQKPL